ncbi:hypothetical protein J6590_038249 [Homalodisca vitripennis]|nr:hypothetical protein J6590_038249 [Homalodisca vitripennis]
MPCYRVTLPSRVYPGDDKRMPVTLSQVLVATQTPWQKFGIEVVLSFIIVYTYFVTMDSHRKWLSSSGLSIGAAYLACSLVACHGLIMARFELIFTGARNAEGGLLPKPESDSARQSAVAAINTISYESIFV